MFNTWTKSPAGHNLLPLLRDTAHAAAMTLSDWDDTLRLARQARLLGLLGHRLWERKDIWAKIPPPVQGHLTSAINYAAHRKQMVLVELGAINKAIPNDIAVILLKGAAYIAQGAEYAQGRIPNDVDLLIIRTDLDPTEAALKAAGWVSDTQDAYDQRYYREWSHELPPMRLPGHALEVDLHHTITPVTSRVRADDNILFSGLQAIPGSRFLCLHPFDQIIHASIHLFQDSELSGRLRDFVDIDGMIRQSVRNTTNWEQLLLRAEAHGASRYLWYTLHYCHSWLGTPVPESLALPPPPAVARRLMNSILTHCCLPSLPDRNAGFRKRIAEQFGRLHYHWLRMPPSLLIRHASHKILQGVFKRQRV